MMPIWAGIFDFSITVANYYKKVTGSCSRGRETALIWLPSLDAKAEITPGARLAGTARS